MIASGTEEYRVLQGSINLIARVVPLIFEDKEFFMRSMWHEQAFFSNQINATKLMESISLLLFMPGFTIKELDPEYPPSVTGIDEQLVWKSGVSIMEARNHYETQYDANRISLVRLIIALLSQPLFHAPDEYLVILNPFSTFLTNRRCKNAKNLFMSLLNFVVSYDCAGYVSIRAKIRLLQGKYLIS